MSWFVRDPSKYPQTKPASLADTATALGDPSSAVGRAVETVAGTINATNYGAVADGSVDCSSAVQALIDTLAASGGGTIVFPPGTYKLNVVLKTGVYLKSWAEHFNYLASGSSVATRFIAAGSGAVVDTPATTARCCGIVGINLEGLGADTPCVGVHFRDTDFSVVRRCAFYNFADEGLLVDSASIACVFEDIQAVRCLMNRTRVATAGAVDIAGTDHWASRIEATASTSIEGTVTSANLYCAAIVWRASTGVAQGLIGEISDVGIYVTGGRNRFMACRADLIYGHGWIINGAGANQFDACLGLNNSQAANDTYSHFRVMTGGNLFTGCVCNDTGVNKPKYGVEDLVSSAATKNRYVNCESATAITAQFLSQASNGSGFVFASGSSKTMSANSATPDVTGYGEFITANTVATTITNFTGGVAGQHIFILCNDANTTIQHNGSNISLLNAGNKKLRSGVLYEFVKTGGNWREVSPFPLGVTADVGDAAKSLQARVAEETQIWNTPLTADRAVTLSSTGAYAGAKFRVVRTAASTGAFNLNVGTGPLKALATGQWCDVEYNGSAWVLTAVGAL